MINFADFALDRRIVPGTAPDGTPILSLLAKASFILEPGEILSKEPPVPAALTENDTDVESDLVAWKPLVDVVVVGRAHAPRGKRARFFDAGIVVAGRETSLRVFGERSVDLSRGSVRFTDPTPFDAMPLDRKLAYGGIDAVSDPESVHVYPANPDGMGYRMLLHPQSMHGFRLPCLENPSHLLQPDTLVVDSPDRWTRMPPPRHLGCTSRSSFPRIDLAGLPPDAAMDAKIASQLSLAASPTVGAGGDPPPPPPRRMDPRFFNSAPESLQFPHLAGTETIVLKYMDPDHPQMEFALPGVQPEGWLDVGEGPANMPMVLQNVEIRPDDRLVHLVWRGSCAWAGPDSAPAFTRFEHGLVLA
ncbi:MAG: DUF2169 domain-containing protein [Fibrobacteria bacterium]|nr:DUF2169 domain-containing protein [Fibrobacteria bacterium]